MIKKCGDREVFSWIVCGGSDNTPIEEIDNTEAIELHSDQSLLHEPDILVAISNSQRSVTETSQRDNLLFRRVEESHSHCSRRES